MDNLFFQLLDSSFQPLIFSLVLLLQRLNILLKLLQLLFVLKITLVKFRDK